MKIQDIKISESYRLKHSPNTGWVKVLSKTSKIITCELYMLKGDKLSCIREFTPLDLIKENHMDDLDKIEKEYEDQRQTWVEES